MHRVSQSELQSAHITIMNPAPAPAAPAPAPAAPARQLRRITNADIQSPHVQILEIPIAEIKLM